MVPKFLSAVFVVSLAFCASARASAPAEFGAPRLLQIVDFAGAPLEGTPSEPSFETRGNGLFFTLEQGGTKNIWRAFPDPQDTSRFPRWKALPVTRLRAPKFASHPVAVAGDRFLICVSDATSKNPLVCRFDLRAGTFSPLAPEILRGAAQDEPAVSRDGRFAAFSVRRKNEWQLWGAAVAGGTPFLLAPNARRPAWETDESLFFESVASESRGVYRRSLEGGAATLFLREQAEISVLNPEQIVFSAYGTGNSLEREKTSRLFVISGDGSGLRALGESEGARRPAISADGRFLAFDAPLLRDSWPASLQNSARGLWLVPLLRDAQKSRATPAFGPQIVAHAAKEPKPRIEPFAKLHEAVARTESNGAIALAVRATLRGEPFEGEAPLRVTLEAGEGQNPRVWTPIPALQSSAENVTIALWKPAKSGTWTLRLSLVAANGAAQNQLRVRVSEKMLAPIPFPAPTPAPTPRNEFQSPILPPLPPPAPFPTRQPTPKTAPTPAPAPIPAPTPVSTPAPVAVSAGNPASFAANFNVSGTLARMAPGQKSSVTFWGHNLGNTTWQTGGNGPDRVRVVARWVDFSTGTRRKWNLFWLKNPVAPGGRIRFDLDLVAPARPGRYKLIYGLVRVPAGGEFVAPPYSVPQEAWPAEFGAIAFAVDVVEGETPAPTP